RRYTELHHEKFVKFGPDRWYRPNNLWSAAASPAPRPRPDADRAGGPGRPCPLGPFPDRERPPRAQAVADRAAGGGAVGASDRPAEPAAAQPPRPAGDRPGRPAPGPVLPQARPAHAEDRRPRAHRRARAPGGGRGRVAGAAVQARRDPGGGPRGE